MSWRRPFIGFKQGLVRNLKSLTRMTYRGDSYRMWGLPRSDSNFIGDVGDGTGSSTVTAPLFWVARTFHEAPPMLWRELENGQEEKILDHALLRLLQRPNAFCTGRVLWMATVIDYMVDGNAYWLKLRNGAGQPTELWWVPSWMIEPKGSKTKLITHYEYQPDHDPIVIQPEDVVHFRFGIDSDNLRLGKSPLKSVLREVYTDDEAAAFTAAILRNMGVPGLVVSPASGISIEREQAEETKATIMAKLTGDRRGEPIVMMGATEIAQFGFSPEQLLLKELRRIPEERVTAVMGVPAMVAGLGAGLDRSTFTNYGEAREAAYEQGIIPMQGILAEEVRFQLLVDYEDPYGLRFGFDLSKVRVLQDDMKRAGERMNTGVLGGWIMVSEARRAQGLEVVPDRDDVFLRWSNVTMVGNDAVVPLAQVHSNGSGADAESEAAVAALVT